MAFEPGTEMEQGAGAFTDTPSLGQTIRDSVSGVVRAESADISPSEKASVKKWLAKIAQAEKHHSKAFKRMRDDMDFAYKYGIGKQWDFQMADDDRYIANFVQRHITSRVSALYAKNPKAVYRRRQRLDFAIWEGDPEAIDMALMQVQEATMLGMPAPPGTIELLMDVQQGVQSRKMADKIGKTQEILFNYFMKEQSPVFKSQMKQMVRRTITCGISYVRPGYQRLMEKKAESQARLSDAMSQLKYLERLRDDMTDSKFDEDSPEMEELRATIQALESDDIVLREGLTFDFPKSTAIVFDTKTTQIAGWIGTDWIAEKWHLPPSEIQEIWRIDIGQNYTKYDYGGPNATPQVRLDFEANNMQERGMACVYKVYDRRSGTCFVVCEGYHGYLHKPYAPDIKVEAFFPIFALAFNQIEHEDEVFPPSDVTLLRHQQKEHNRTREAVRQHRIANRPLYITPTGALEEGDKKSMASYPAHAVIEVDGLKEGQDANKLLQMVEKVAIDPNVYTTAEIQADTQRIVGDQEANIGGRSKEATATQSSIAETTRLSSLASNVDDLDDLLTEVARASGQILLRNMPKEMVMEIVGPGAVWPELTAEEMVKEVWLECEAGSSGRPNKTQELANFERVAPFLVQIPGIRPSPIAQHILKILDANFDLEELIAPGLPSIQALNGLMQQPALPGGPAGGGQPSTGDPATDPAQQAAQGANNTPQGDATQGGPQAPYSIIQYDAQGQRVQA